MHQASGVPGASDEMPSLARRNPLPRDGEVFLASESHTYTRGGTETAPRSVTAVVCGQFEEFDPEATVRRFYNSWRANESSKYHSTISAVLASGADDAAAQAAIRNEWAQSGRLAREAGERAHAALELLANDLPHADLPEVRLFKRWWEMQKLQFFRTELVTFVENARGNLLLAGSADLVATDEHGRHVLIDYKRSQKKLSIDETSYKNRKGRDFCDAIPDTDYWKYSLQLSLYNVMLRRTQQVDCEDRMFLCNVHPEQPEAAVAKAADLRAVAEELIEAEEGLRAARKRPRP